MEANDNGQLLIDLDDPNIEISEESHTSSSTTEVQHETHTIEYTTDNQTEFKVKFEEAQFNLNDLESELRMTREKLNQLQNACETTEGKLSLLKDATFLYQSVVSKHEITFKTITEENRILKIRLSKVQHLEKELEEERETNAALNDRVAVLERVKEHANEEIGRMEVTFEQSNADMEALRDRIHEYEIMFTNLQKELDDKDEEIIKLRFEHTEEVDGLKGDLNRKHDDFVVHAEKSETLAQECDILRQDKALGEENLLKEMESLKLKYDQIEQEKGVLENEKEEIYHELNGLEERLQDLEGLQAERFELKKENEEFRVRIEMLVSENKKLEDEKSEILEELGKLEDRLQDIDSLQDDRDELLLKYKDLKSKYDEMLAEISELIDQIKILEDKEEKLKDEMEDLRKKYGYLETEKAELLDSVKHLEEEEVQLKKEAEDLRSTVQQLRDYQAKYKTMLVEKETLERKLSDESRTVKELRVKLTSIQKENDELSGKERTQRNKINELEREVRDANREKERLQKQLKDVNERADTSAKKVDELKARIRELEKEIREKDREIKDLHEDNKKLDEELDTLTDTLENGKVAYGKMVEEVGELKDENERLRIELEGLKAKPEEIMVIEEAPIAASAPELDFGLSGELDALKRELETTKDDKKNLEEELDKTNTKYDNMYEELTRNINVLDERCETYRKEIIEKEVIITQIRREEIRYKERIEELETLLEGALKDDLADKSEDLSNENDALRKKIIKLEGEIRFLSEELKNADDLSVNESSELERDIKALKAKVEQLEKQAREDEREIERLKRLEPRRSIRDDDWKNQYNTLKIQFDSLERDRDFIKREKDRLHKEYVEADDELQNIRARHSKTKKMLDEANIEITSLNVQIMEYERKTTKVEIVELKRRLKSREDELEILRSELKGMDGAEWPQRYESLKLKYEELDGEKGSLSREKSELQRELRISAERVAELEIKLSHGSGDEKRLREEIRLYQIKITELESSSSVDDKITIERLLQRIVELEEEILRLKKLLMTASDDSKKHDSLLQEVEDLEKEVIILTHEIELRTAETKELTQDNDDLYIRVKEYENRPIPEPQRIQITESINAESAPEGVSPFDMPFDIPHETTTLIIDVVFMPEIVLGILMRSKQRNVPRIQGNSRSLSQYEFVVEALPGTFIVGAPVAVKVDASETPTLQHPDLLDGIFDSISPDMMEMSESAPDAFSYGAEPERSVSPVAQTLEANAANDAYPMFEVLEQRPGAFRLVAPKPPNHAPRNKGSDSMTPPRGKLVPIRAVIKDSTAVVQRVEPTMLAPDIDDDSAFLPVDVDRSSQQDTNGYPNGYHDDDFIYPRELQKRYVEVKEVKAVKPTEIESDVVDYKQVNDDGVVRATTWQPVEEMPPVEMRERRSVGSMGDREERRSLDERIIREQRRDMARGMDEETRQRRREKDERSMRRNKEERRSFDERKMKANRRQMESSRGDERERGEMRGREENRRRGEMGPRGEGGMRGENRRGTDDREMRGMDQSNIGWDRRLTGDDHHPLRDLNRKPDTMLWL